jgi:putative ABC transport system substrate-binding protein
MRRRDFIKVIVGSATSAWPLGARAQQPADGMRRIAVMVGYAEDDPEAQTRLAAFKQGLLTLGWSEGRNVKIDVRWASGRHRSRDDICKRTSGTTTRSDHVQHHASNRRVA